MEEKYNISSQKEEIKNWLDDDDSLHKIEESTEKFEVSDIVDNLSDSDNDSIFEINQEQYIQEESNIIEEISISTEETKNNIETEVIQNTGDTLLDTLKSEASILDIDPSFNENISNNQSEEQIVQVETTNQSNVFTLDDSIEEILSTNKKDYNNQEIDMFLQSTNKILSEVKEEESNIEIGNFFNKTDEFVNQRNNFFEPVKLNIGVDESDDHVDVLFGAQEPEINSFVYEKREDNRSLIQKILDKDPDSRRNLMIASTVTLSVIGLFTGFALFSQNENSFVANASPLPKIMSQNLMSKTEKIKEQIVLGELYSDESYISYPLKQGDTLTKIAMKTNVDQEAIKVLNNIYSDKDLSSNQSVIIPTVDGIIHRIAPGETIGSVAVKHNVSLKEITAINKKNLKNVNFIQINQPLFIPVKQQEEQIKKKEKQTFLDRSKKIKNVLAKGLQKVDDIELKETISRENNFIHKLEKGQTLADIAKKYNVTVAAINTANKGVNIWQMKPNQPIIVPISKINRNLSRNKFMLASRSLGLNTYSSGAKSSSRFFWPAVGEFSSGFGPRWGRMHSGIDIAAEVGTPIYAVMSGKVTLAEWSSGYGLTVEITHENGMVTRYAHCSELLVKVGDEVKGGKHIAAMGLTGNVTGPHVHFEVLIKGEQVDPMKYL
jgi:murein DD-endopeptidase MepM/ murein hydrolase activator NlpD